MGKDDVDSLKPRIGTQRTIRPAKPSQQPEPSLGWNQGDLGLLETMNGCVVLGVRMFLEKVYENALNYSLGSSVKSSKCPDLLALV